MHVLMTADTIGGVWTYTRELVTRLSRRGVRITLVSFGDIPTADQARWIEPLEGVTYHPTPFRLEWMQDAQQDLDDSAGLLRSIIEETKPDLLHSNQFFYGALDCDIPKLVVAHSDVVSWWVSVHGAEPPASEWIAEYRMNVTRGLSAADVVVAPSRWMLEQTFRYTEPKRPTVVYNGRDPNLFVPHVSKEQYAVSVGRLWDAGKQATLLLHDDLPLKVVLVGSQRSPEGSIASIRSLENSMSALEMRGPQSEAQLRQLLARAGVYVATSRYEPFGLAPVEAALSRCAIVANDIPTFREVWGDDAVYFKTNNSQALVNAIQELASNPTKRSEYGARALDRARKQFNSHRMAEDYLELYRTLVSAEAAAA
jgi:glycosyltransferase involved in cell wall biosynthesis